jgi:excisionase family DNA binding protein
MTKNRPTTTEPTAEILDDIGASRLLGVEVRTLREWRVSRGLPHIRITPRTIRFKRADLIEWLGHFRTATK